MNRVLLLLIILTGMQSLLTAETDAPSTDFNLEYSLDWTPFHYSILRVEIENTTTESYLITIMYAGADRTSGGHRLVDFTAGPFSVSEVMELKNLKTEGESIRSSCNRLFQSIKSKPLFLVETARIKSGNFSSIKIFKNERRFFEIWRLWKPHWIFVADLRKMNPEKQRELFLDEFKIKGWVEY